MGRKLTLEVEIDQPMADWIWESHAEGLAHDGVRIVSISEGHASHQADREQCACADGQGGPCSFCMETKYNL